MRETIRALLTGCAVLPMLACSQLPPTHYYVLEAAHPAAEAHAEGWRIGVRRFHVDAPYDRSSLAYRVGETSPEIRYYAYHQWAAPLSDLMAEATAEGLGGTAGIGAIEPLRPGRDYDALLEGRLLAIEEIDLPGGDQRLRLDLDLALVSARGEQLWTESLRLERTTSTVEVEGIVRGFGELLAEGLQAARAPLAATLTAAR